MKAFVIEDDTALSIGIEYVLKQEGYTVFKAATLKAARDLIEREASDDTIALFDVMLPDGNGFELLKEVRDKGYTFPVIYLTAVSDEANVVQGLDIGADDYITKPFRVKELMSRIRSVTRRYGMGKSEAASSDEIRYRSLIIDKSRASVCKVQEDGTKEVLSLTSNEYKLLLYFIENRGVTLERTQILDRLFDNQGSFIDDNTLSVYLKRVREKIGDTDKDNPYIKTIRGIGYLMEKE